jgi:hypothetical protein
MREPGREKENATIFNIVKDENEVFKKIHKKQKTDSFQQLMVFSFLRETGVAPATLALAILKIIVSILKAFVLLGKIPFLFCIFCGHILFLWPQMAENLPDIAKKIPRNLFFQSGASLASAALNLLRQDHDLAGVHLKIDLLVGELGVDQELLDQDFVGRDFAFHRADQPLVFVPRTLAGEVNLVIAGNGDLKELHVGIIGSNRCDGRLQSVFHFFSTKKKPRRPMTGQNRGSMFSTTLILLLYQVLLYFNLNWDSREIIISFCLS